MNLSDYKAIRESGKEIGGDIFKYAVDSNKQDLISAAKLLGFWNGKMMVFDSEADSETLMDFMVFEKINTNLPACKRFQMSNPKLNAIQKEQLDGIINNYCSLFEVKSIDPVGNTLVLEDLLDPGKKEYLLMDIGMSRTTQAGFILFTRLIPIRDINITSGVSFAFDRAYKENLLSAFSFASFKKRRKLTSSEIYILFHDKKQQFGIETRTESV
jgi:spore coat protein CotF